MAVRSAYLVVAASLLMMLHCCNHVCLCEENGVSEDSEDDDLSLEVEDEEEATVSVFEPTHEWKTVEEGQAIPPGLHIRMNMETGKKEAKLMDDVTTAQESEKTADTSGPGSETNTPQNKQTETPPTEAKKAKPGGGGGAVPSPGFFFRGDQRRAHHYGHSDRRGIINLRRRMLTHRDVAAALRKFDESNAQLSKRPPGRITHSQPASGDPSSSQKANAPSGQGVTVVQQDKEGGRMERPMMHRELKEMLRHTKTLARKSATIPELLQALEELEYHVHHIENAKELNSIGGLVVVVRLLNHTHPDIRSSAAHVIGAATQSNPHVQSEVLDYGGLQLLCAFINSGEPELVQRRGLFALSALLRGNTQPQLAFVQECRGLMQLGLDFQERAMPTQLKIVTLLTDLLHEQDQLMHNSEELKSLLHSSVQEHGWCQHVPSLLHSKTLSPTEKALQAMSVLQHLCDFTSHLPRLQELQRQFEAAVKQEEDEVSQSLLDHSQELLRNIRNRNKEL